MLQLSRRNTRHRTGRLTTFCPGQERRLPPHHPLDQVVVRTRLRRAALAAWRRLYFGLANTALVRGRRPSGPRSGYIWEARTARHRPTMGTEGAAFDAHGKGSPASIVPSGARPEVAAGHPDSEVSDRTHAQGHRLTVHARTIPRPSVVDGGLAMGDDGSFGQQGRPHLPSQPRFSGQLGPGA